MAKKSNFVKNLTVGGKALVGSIIQAIIMMIIVLPLMALSTIVARPVFWVFVVLIYMISSVLVLGWLYRILWKWK